MNKMRVVRKVDVPSMGFPVQLEIAATTNCDPLSLRVYEVDTPAWINVAFVGISSSSLASASYTCDNRGNHVAMAEIHWREFDDVTILESLGFFVPSRIKEIRGNK